MHKSILNIILSLVLFISTSINLSAQDTFHDSLENGENFKKAAFSLWIPKDLKQIKGVIVLVPGSNNDGRGKIQDSLWQNLAIKHSMALVGAYFTDSKHENMAVEAYCDVDKGSGQALLDILSRFAEKSKHTELKEAPLALWGFSAGGQFNYEFVCWKPERVIAFVVNKGGVYYTSLTSQKAMNVPGLFFTGEMDSPYRTNIVKGIFSVNRRFGAKWLYAQEPKISHKTGKSEAFSRLFFDEVFPFRLSEGNHILQDLKMEGIIGKNESKTIFHHSSKQEPHGITSWLLNKKIADAWLDLIK